MLFKDVQYENAEFSIVLRPQGNTTFDKDVHPENADAPKEVEPFGNTILANDVQF